jgi:hypothetical protein
LCVMPGLVLLLLHFQFLLSDLPSTATERAFVTNKLSVCTSNILSMHYYAFSFFSLRSLLTLFLYCIPSFFLLLFSFYWFSSFTTFAAVLTVDSYSFFFVAFSNIYTNWCYAYLYSDILQH